jgi:hypothetical protein
LPHYLEAIFKMNLIVTSILLDGIYPIYCNTNHCI